MVGKGECIANPVFEQVGWRTFSRPRDALDARSTHQMPHRLLSDRDSMNSSNAIGVHEEKCSRRMSPCVPTDRRRAAVSILRRSLTPNTLRNAARELNPKPSVAITSTAANPFGVEAPFSNSAAL